MRKFLPLLRKNERTVVGVLSGTSVDAVDVVITKIKGSSTSTRVKVLGSYSFPIDKKLKEFIIVCSSIENSNVEDITKLNFILGNLFADCVKRAIAGNKLTTNKIDLIGSHGQTIYHFPTNKNHFGYNSRSTLQIGDPSVIAVKTGITTVGDFRIADVAAGGNGAPLVSYLDYILFSSKTKNRVFINIGGIANVTYLKKSGKQNDVVAFDTGPGNMLIDEITQRLYKKRYDKDGLIASSGVLNKKLFKYLCTKDKFYKKKFPKTTGREYYGASFVNDILKNFSKLKRDDIINTITQFTAFTIFHNLKKFAIDEIVLSGGGALNRFLLSCLMDHFPHIEVKVIDESGIDHDNKEAVLFAVLANELIEGNVANITSVTGAEKNVFLGKICLA